MSNALVKRFDVRLLASGVLAAVCISPAWAADPAPGPDLVQIEARLRQQETRIDEQERRLTEQGQVIEAQGAEIRALRFQRDQALADIRAGYAASLAAAEPGAASRPMQTAALQAPGNGQDLPRTPVGEAPAQPTRRLEADAAALPQGMGVLTPDGKLVVEPTLEFVRASSNRLVFRGIEVVPGVQLGVIEANDADRDSLVGSLVARYGLGGRFEIEGRIPYVYRHDRVTTVAQRDETVTRTIDLESHDLGDVEVSARYQITKGMPGDPIFVAGLRVKPPTGVSPFDIPYDQFGVATELATGSGFWGTEASVTMLYPTDPAVIWGGLSYLYNAPDDINKVIGDVRVGRVDPGDSIGFNIGFGLALNPRFSMSLGYSHNFILGTETELGETTQKSNSLQVGALQFGMSYRLTPRISILNSFEFGVTSDAPDMRMMIRVPYTF